MVIKVKRGNIIYTNLRYIVDLNLREFNKITMTISTNVSRLLFGLEFLSVWTSSFNENHRTNIISELDLKWRVIGNVEKRKDKMATK